MWLQGSYNRVQVEVSGQMMDLLQTSVQTHFENQSFLTDVWKVVIIVINCSRTIVMIGFHCM